MTAVHIVKPGEHIAAIATRFGFENFSELWNHPSNAELKQLRKSPFLLAAGDQVFIPDRVRLEFKRATAASHDFRANIDRIDIKLRLLGLDAKPRANAAITVEVERPDTGEASSNPQQELTTDGDGRVTVEISKTCEVGGVTIDGLELELQIGGLDPIDTDVGLAQRLTNLGYFVPIEELEEPALAKPAASGAAPGAKGSEPASPPPAQATAGEADAQEPEAAGEADAQEPEAAGEEPPEEENDDLRSAIEEFQCDQSLTVNGKKDDAAMLAKLEELHGS